MVTSTTIVVNKEGVYNGTFREIGASFSENTPLSIYTKRAIRKGALSVELGTNELGELAGMDVADLGDLATKDEADLGLGDLATQDEADLGLGDLATKDEADLPFDEYMAIADLKTLVSNCADFAAFKVAVAAIGT